MSTTSEGRPGRYQRSAGGLAVALVVTVVAVLALLGVLRIFRSDLEVDPERVDYLDTVEGLQDSGLSPAYPATLPEGWIATAAGVPTDDDVLFELNLLTDDDRFVGVREAADTSVLTLVTAHVDDDATETEPYRAEGSVARDWQGFEDGGGDTAYAAEVGGRVVLVYGSAPAADLQQVVEQLTREPVPAS